MKRRGTRDLGKVDVEEEGFLGVGNLNPILLVGDHKAAVVCRHCGERLHGHFFSLLLSSFVSEECGILS